jgi:thiol-disulfide isomerase/thioredoxin
VFVRPVLAVLAALVLAPLPGAGDDLVAGHSAAPLAWLGQVPWVNHAPLTADALRGRVVLVSFWTFECINCRRTLPALRTMARRWRDGDVVLIGVHTPELPQEYDRAGLERAVARLGVSWPVAQDNDAIAWRAFGTEAWPTLYVIDRRGAVRDVHVGELHEGTAAWRRVTGLIEALRRGRG